MGSFEADQDDWLAEQLAGIPTALASLRPSEWAEQKRYLPPTVGPLPGHFRFDVTPYMREPLDCMSPDSPVREVVVMKGVQIAYTTAVLENTVGYLIDHLKTASSMLVTADADMAKVRLESFIKPMLQASGLMELIRSSDESNNRKTGNTDKKLEWLGGGFLLPIGAQNPNKFRAIPVQYLLADEVDGWATTVKGGGDPIKLVIDRTAAYEQIRKLLFGSTPLLKGSSRIDERYQRTDRCKYHVRCLRCSFPQELRWRHKFDQDTGATLSGIVWETNGGILVPESVRYLCQECGHAHFNHDKTRLLAESEGAVWVPTATSVSPFVRGFHISALYSPPGMQTWAACVAAWLEAWDEERRQHKDPKKLQVFYNQVLGKPFAPLGQKVRLEIVSTHRRGSYVYGEIPNKWCKQFCGSPVLLLTCAVDVHADSLDVAVFGWCRDRRAVLIEYKQFLGDTEQLDNKDTWEKLADLLESREYVADDGKRYRIQLALIDSGYRTDNVYEFAARYPAGVFPLKGRDMPTKSANLKEFSETETPMGARAYTVTVDVYKDRWAASLRRSWDGLGLQPYGHFNAPRDATDAQLKELTVETRRQKFDKDTNQLLGNYWHRPGGVRNELWDLLVYNNAALDIVCLSFCTDQLGLEWVDENGWQDFYRIAEEQKVYFS